MDTFEGLRRKLYDNISGLVDAGAMFKAKRDGEYFDVNVPEAFKEEFFKLIDRVNLSLLEDKENFYGYFIFQMGREIRFDITSPTGINFKGARYVIYFNPIIFLQLDINQMQTTIKHEIHHVLSLHQIRAKELKGKFSTLAINLAMDVVVNQYLNYLPPYAITLEWVNLEYGLRLEPYNTMEYYVEKIQNAVDLLEDTDKGEEDDTKASEDKIKDEFNPEETHNIWDEADDIDEKTMKEFTEKFVATAQKGKIPLHLEGMIAALKNSKGEIPWNLLLKKLMGTVESNRKKTITRRNRRQPDRMDLRGELRSHKANIIVAIDISGSISDEEFKQAIKEVLSIVKNYNNEITIVECDTEIKRAYKVKSMRDVKERAATGGGTKFSPVFEYANARKGNLLIYFTDGKGEDKLLVPPRGYKTLWVLSAGAESLSLRKPFGAVKKLQKVEDVKNTIDISDVRSDGWSMNHQEPDL